jgi:hypothetical protein
MSELFWTNKKPIQEGWYWYVEMVGRCMSLLSIVQVIDITCSEDEKDKVLIAFKGCDEVDISCMRGNWAGPLVPPTL